MMKPAGGWMIYERCEKLTCRAAEIAAALGYDHIDLERVACIRSKGSKTRRTIARIHGMGRAFTTGLGIKPCYVIEFLSEKFDRLSPEEQTKTILHELMHIPRGFGGGFRHHKNWVNHGAVESEYRRLLVASASLPGRCKP